MHIQLKDEMGKPGTTDLKKRGTRRIKGETPISFKARCSNGECSQRDKKIG